MTSLEQSILSALVYFDMFDYPLTVLELHRWLYRPDREYSINEVAEALSRSFLQRVVSSQHGFFCLAGREGIVQERQRRYRLSAAKFRRARRISRLFSYFPFVRLIAVANTLAYRNAAAGSDIDLFIITKAGGVWWTRFLTLLFLKLLRLRPGQGGNQDKICLSFFVDDEHLLPESERPAKGDIHQPYWYATLEPVYDAGGYYQKLWQANDWLKDWLPHVRPIEPHPRAVRRHRPIFRLAAEQLLLPFSFMARRLQERAFPQAIRALMNQDTRVRVEDGLLKFHTTNRRRQYAAEFTRKISTVVNDFMA